MTSSLVITLSTDITSRISWKRTRTCSFKPVTSQVYVHKQRESSPRLMGQAHARWAQLNPSETLPSHHFRLVIWSSNTNAGSNCFHFLMINQFHVKRKNSTLANLEICHHFEQTQDFIVFPLIRVNSQKEENNNSVHYPKFTWNKLKTKSCPVVPWVKLEPTYSFPLQNLRDLFGVMLGFFNSN